MNEQSKKKRNTAVFILIATVINVVLMMVFMIGGYLLLARFGSPEDTTANQIWLIVVFIGSIALAWFIYSMMIKWYTKRVDVEKKFAPLITPRKKKRPVTDEDEISGVKR